MSVTAEPNRPPRLVGGIHRDVTGRADEPLRFYVSLDRGLRSGRLDDVTVSVEDLLRLNVESAQALALIYRADPSRVVAAARAEQ